MDCLILLPVLSFTYPEGRSISRSSSGGRNRTCDFSAYEAGALPLRYSASLPVKDSNLDSMVQSHVSCHLDERAISLVGRT